MQRSGFTHSIIHIVCWLVFLALPLIFIGGEHRNFAPVLSMYVYWRFCLYFAVLFYLNTQILIPKLYLKRRTRLYYSAIFLLLVFTLLFKPFDQLVNNNQALALQMERTVPNGPTVITSPPPRKVGIDIASAFLFVMIITLGMALSISRQWRLSEQRATLAETDKANAELSFLKAQINPHFIFNTLNNIYTLAITNNSNTPESILKLSNIMRHITEDAISSQILLRDEIEFITDYIDLQKLRLGENTPINYSIKGTIAEQRIAPLLLITFIENVFKYGISKHEKSPVTIALNYTGNLLIFKTINQIFPHQQSQESTGIGLINTRKRLDHLYAGKYKLDIATKENTFTVTLHLEI